MGVFRPSPCDHWPDGTTEYRALIWAGLKDIELDKFLAMIRQGYFKSGESGVLKVVEIEAGFE